MLVPRRWFVFVLSALVTTTSLSSNLPTASAEAVTPAQAASAASAEDPVNVPLPTLSNRPDPAATSAPAATAVNWPGPGSAQVQATAAWVKVPDLPVEVRVAPGEAVPDGGVSVRVQLLEPQGLSRSVLWWKVTGASGEQPAQRTQLRLDYAGFRDTFGGDWAGRLAVKAFPACVLAQVDAPGCGDGTPVPATNDLQAGTLEFTIDGTGGSSVGGTSSTALPSLLSGGSPLSPSLSAMVADSGTSSGSTVYAVSSTASGPSGNYSATPVNQAGDWQVSPGSGEFSYSYPFEVPKALGGAAPGLSMSYSSASVDGLTSVENSQAGMLGLGWDLSSSYISRSYGFCSEDGETYKGDLCWITTPDKDGTNRVVDIFSIVLNGRSSELVPVPGHAWQFRLASDPAWRVELISDAHNAASEGVHNADNSHEAFKVRTPDGTLYWFGKRGNVSNSVWTVPVYGNDAGEPCHDPNSAANSWCQQGWRWNLDKVVDPNGNVIKYNYTTETNAYARWGSSSSANSTEYDRGGWLSSIEYGYPRGGSAYTDARQRVDFDTALRCKTKVNDETKSCTAISADPSAASDYPDVPADLMCYAGSSCTNYSPSFFSTHRYTDVKTSIVRGTSTRLVDTYDFNFSYPYPDAGFSDSGDVQDLWLKQVQRIGKAGDGTDEPAKPVQFHGVSLQNRVDPGSGELHLRKFRVWEVRNELGGVTQVTYGHAGGRTCDAAYVSGRNQWGSKRECFPQKYAPDGGSAQWEWFHKYVVTRIALGDNTLGYDQDNPGSSSPNLGTLRVYDYEYQNAPAWRYRQGPLHPSDQETWNDWRGYEQTIIHTRSVVDGVIGPDDESQRRVVVYRGMNNTRADDSGGTNTNVTLTTEEGRTRTDRRRFQGRVAESEQMRSGGIRISMVDHDYSAWQTATNPWGARPNAFVTAETETRTYYRVDGDDNGRETRVVYTVYDGGADHLGTAAGKVTATDDKGITGKPSDNVCTTQDYWTNSDPDVWMVRPRKTAVYDVKDCSSASTASETSRKRVFYDGMIPGGGSNSGSDLVEGNPTDVRTWSDDTTYTDASSAFDLYGRVKQTTDDRGLVTDTDYNPGGDNGDVVSEVKTTVHGPHSRDLVTDTNLFARRGLPNQITDPNGNVTTLSYDGLGRLVSVVLPDNTTGKDSMKFSYNIDAQSPVLVTSKTLVDDSHYVAKYAYYDGWGRSIETQTPQADGSGRVIATTTYGDQGLPTISIPAIPSAADPGSGFFNPSPDNRPRTIRTSYDAVGRKTYVALVSNGTELWGTNYTNHGDRVVVSPPGKNNTITYHDAHGRPSTVEQYLNGAIDTAADYTYTPSGQIKTITSTVENSANDSQELTWAYGYDWKGRRISADDPDTGLTTTSYDDVAKTSTVKTPADPAITTTVDVLGRPVSKTDDSGTPLTEWTYDTTPGGLGLLSQVTHHNGALGDVTNTVNSYDGRGHVTSSTTTIPADWVDSTTSGGNPYDYTVTKTYGQSGELKSVTYPSIGGLGSDQVDFKYNSLGFYDRTESTLDLTGSNPLAQATYDARNRLTNLDSRYDATTQTAAMTRTYTYDAPTNRLVEFAVGKVDLTGVPPSATATTWLDEATTYDEVGNPTRVQDLTNTSQDVGICYTYDGQSRLTHAATSTIDTSTGDCTDSPGVGVFTTPYVFDYGYAPQGGALTSVTQTLDGQQSAQVDYNYPAANTTGVPPHGLTSTSVPSGVDPTSLYVADGSITYDTNGRIATWTDNSGGTPGVVTNYTYDEEGNLQKTEPASGTGLTTKNAYDDAGLRVARKTTDASGTTTTTVFLGATELTTIDGQATTATRTYTTADGTPVATRGISGITWLAADRLGNIRVTRVDGQPDAVRHDYTPYGDPLQTVATLPNQRGYLDKTHDPSGDIRLDHRAYNPTLGVLTTPDPLLDTGDPQNLNPYTYARNNPITLVDPSGLSYADPQTGSDVSPHCVNHCNKYDQTQAKAIASSPDANNDGQIDHYWEDTVAGAANLYFSTWDTVAGQFVPGARPGDAISRRIDNSLGADRSRAAYYNAHFLAVLTTFMTIGPEAAGPELLGAGRAGAAGAETIGAAETESGLIRLSTEDSWARPETLARHFRDHGADFGATSADDYARMASEFFQRGGAEQLPTKIASDGTIRMYDPATNTFGSYAPDGLTKTFFKPTSPTYWSRQPGVLQ